MLLNNNQFALVGGSMYILKESLAKLSVLRRLFFCGIFLCGLAHGQPTGGTAVDFPSADAAGNVQDLRGVLWLPAGPARGAVVLVHGSGGWSDHREGHHGRALSAAGFAALAIDAFGPRGFAQSADNQALLSQVQMARDAFAARRFLVEKGFAPERIAVMGFSKGGGAVLLTADRTFLPEEADRFALAIAFYPACNAKPRVPKPASLIFMALGEKDNLTGVKPCEELASGFQKAGGTITIKVYPDASHAFDGDPARTAMINLRFMENYLDCNFDIEEDGQISFGGKTYGPYESSFEAMRADMRKTCVKNGAFIWTNPRQKEAATRDVVEFLGAHFAN